MKNEELRMPSIGLGTYLSKESQAKEAVKDAIEIGYRHIDTASFYQNEKEIGEAIKESNILRHEIFITTKLWNDVNTYDETIDAFNLSLKNLNLEYIDLYLIHWPGSKKRNSEVWRAMEDLLEQNKIKAIGVSNFQIHHINDLLETAKIVPMMNQVELHPHLQQHSLQDYCNEQGIAITAYGPFARGHVDDNEVLKKIAKKHNKTIQQIILRWGYQRGIFMIPKSINRERIESNFLVNDFKLSLAEMDLIKTINTARRYYPDPDNLNI